MWVTLDPQFGRGDGSMHSCLQQNPRVSLALGRVTGTFLVMGRVITFNTLSLALGRVRLCITFNKHVFK